MSIRNTCVVVSWQYSEVVSMQQISFFSSALNLISESFKMLANPDVVLSKKKATLEIINQQRIYQNHK